MEISPEYALAHLNQVKGLMVKADGKDKFIGLVQYLAMFASAGEAGNALSIMKSMGSSRKVFRFYKPIEFLLPVLNSKPKGKGIAVFLEYAKALSMAGYMCCDHVVWAGSVGLVNDKEFLKNMQQASMYGWFSGSVITALQQAMKLNKLMKAARDASTPEEKAAANVAVNECAFALVTALSAATLAMAILEKVNLDKRQTGALGIFVSLCGLYTAMPKLERPKVAKKED